MPQITRATLPQEFYDITSAKLLVQPEPQRLHAALLKMAIGANLSAGGPLGFMAGRQFGTNGFDYPTEPSVPLMMSNPIATESIEVVLELGKTPGHTIRMNRPAYPATTNADHTEAVREVAAGTTISTTPIAAQSEQVCVTVKRYAGPHDIGGAAPQPIGIDRFDCSFMLHRPAQVAGLQLVRDFNKTLDVFGRSLFDMGTAIRPDGMTNDNFPTAAGDYPMDYQVLTAVERSMDEGNVPTFGDGRRCMILSPYQVQQLKEDARWQRSAENFKEYNELFKGQYVGTTGTFHVLKSNTLTVVANTSTVDITWGQAFGPSSVGAGIAEFPRVANATQDNYGETALVIWLMYGGFACIDNRFQRSIRTS